MRGCSPIRTPSFGTEKGLMGKLKDAVDPDKT
nr:hypothetical protein CPGR_03980 [Mycolicibacterium komanii]